MSQASRPGRDGTAILLLVLLALAWGLSWPAVRIILDEVPPWTLRVLGYANGWYRTERTPEAFLDAARAVLAKGFKAFKMFKAFKSS